MHCSVCTRQTYMFPQEELNEIYCVMYGMSAFVVDIALFRNISYLYLRVTSVYSFKFISSLVWMSSSSAISVVCKDLTLDHFYF